MNCVYQVCVGPQSQLYRWCTESVQAYCKKIGADYVVQTEPRLRITPDPETTGRSKQAVSRLGYLPIFEKENAFELLHDYDAVAVIDADVFVRTSAPSIFDALEGDFAAVRERDSPVTEKYKAKLRKYSDQQYGNLPDVEWNWNDDGADFMNMGIMVMAKSILPYLWGQTPKEFIRRPEFKGFVDGLGKWKWSTDQTLLNWWVRESGMKVQGLDWRFNALFNAVLEERLPEAWFTHFFLRDHLPNKGEDTKELERHVIV